MGTKSSELTDEVRAAYRVGGFFTNILIPLLPYFPLVIIFAQRYDEDAGIGSIIAPMLPYFIGFGIVGTIDFLLRVLGPAAGAGGAISCGMRNSEKGRTALQTRQTRAVNKLRPLVHA